MEKYLAIDLGRTKLRYAVITDGLDILDQGSEYTDIQNEEQVFAPIKKIADQYRGKVEGLSLTMPGVIDSANGIAYSGGVYGWVRDYPYAQKLSEYIGGMPVVIAKDAKAAAMAEIGYGALKNIQNGVMLLILNTGIGGAVIHNGKILDGAHFASGEVSYIRGDYKRRDDYNDMFALACSIDGLSRAVEETSGKANLNILRIMAKVASGDEAVTKGVENYCDRLALYMYNIQCVIDAEAFVIGGHLTDEPRTMKMIREAVVRQFGADRYGNVFRPEIKECVFHNNSRMYGAVYNFRLQTGRLK